MNVHFQGEAANTLSHIVHKRLQVTFLKTISQHCYFFHFFTNNLSDIQIILPIPTISYFFFEFLPEYIPPRRS